jgi:hypothetical protein
MLPVFLTALATQVAANLPFTMPAGIPDPLAYYWLNDHAPGTGAPGAPPSCTASMTGCAGMTVKESISGVVDAGYVDYDTVDQPKGEYPGVTWVDDPHFGNVFQCGNSLTEAKDVVRLKDVDYGGPTTGNGKFTLNWWVKNPPGTDFDRRQKEQLFGHGDPHEISNAPNQIHIQVENLHVSNGHNGFNDGDHIYKDEIDTGGDIILILADSNDAQSCFRSAAGGARTPEGTIPLEYLGGQSGVSADGKYLTMNNPKREEVEDNSSRNVKWENTGGRRRTTGVVDVFPAMTCDALFTDLNAEGTASVGGGVVDMARVLTMCVDASGQPVTDEGDAMMCGRVSRARTIYTQVFEDDERTSVNRPGTIGVSADGTASGADDGWHMLTITTRPDGKKGFAFYIDGVKRAALPSEAGVGWDRYDYNNGGDPMNGGDPIDPVGPFRFCGREIPGDWTGEANVQFDARRNSNVQLAHFSVYNEAMTDAQIEDLRQAYVTRFFPDAAEGYSSLPGACRGPGKKPQKVNSKYKTSMTLAECKQECDSNAGQCKGFAYNPTANNGECLIYGPGFAGSCSVAGVKTKPVCESLGTCADTNKCDGGTHLGQACKDKCGDCSDTTADTKTSCENVGAIWTPLAWTAAPGTWTEPTDGWTGDSYGDTIVASVRQDDTSGYRCYDNDKYDHHPQCTGTIPVSEAVKSGTHMSDLTCTEAEVSSGAPGCGSTSDFSCATSTCGGSDCGDCDGCASTCAFCASCNAPGDGGWFGACSSLFLGLTMSEKTPEICSDIDGCTFVDAIVPAVITPIPHAKAEQYPGWQHMSGACRADDVGVKVNGKYSKTAGAGGAPATQTECKDHCDANDDCLGYAHQDNGWCLNYGPGLNVTDATWAADSHPNMGPILIANGNVQYICGVKVDEKSASPPKSKIEEQVSESCRPGAMLALAFWLTRLWQ